MPASVSRASACVTTGRVAGEGDSKMASAAARRVPTFAEERSRTPTAVAMAPVTMSLAMTLRIVMKGGAGIAAPVRAFIQEPVFGSSMKRP